MCLVQFSHQKRGPSVFVTFARVATLCVESFFPRSPQIITHNRHRGGTIVIDKRSSDVIVTSLIISQAEASDSGTYTCDPASSYSQAVVVHVTKGEVQEVKAAVFDVDVNVVTFHWVG